MALHKPHLPPWLEPPSEDNLRNLVVYEGLESFRSLSDLGRGKLIKFLTKCGIPPSQGHLFSMLLDDRHPDILTEKTLTHMREDFRTRVISNATLQAQPQKPKAQKKPDKTKRRPRELIEQKEIIDRFENLGIDILEVLMDWTVFYENHAFSKAVAKATNADPYTIDVPAMSNEAMEILEKKWAAGEIDRLMVDDGRLRDGKTLRIFEPETFKKFHVENKFSDTSTTEAFLDRTTSSAPIVRLVGYSSKPPVFNGRQHSKCYQEYGYFTPFENNMGLGTLLRLQAFLEEKNPFAIQGLETYTVQTKDAEELKLRTVLLNNKTTKNKILTFATVQNPNREHDLKIGEDITRIAPFYQTPIRIFVSDNPGLLKKTDSIEAHRDTLPAPAPANDEDDGA